MSPWISQDYRISRNLLPHRGDLFLDGIEDLSPDVLKEFTERS